jgi:CubicO group peptidase (beta-lactamase class C family)
MKIGGHVEPGFEKVREAFERNLIDGHEIGASFAAFRGGRPLVNLWGGFRDRAGTDPWQADTLVNVWSTTKGIAAICCAILVDRGRLDYTAPVARYWPEFGRHGKENVTVAMLLSHQAGLCATREPVTYVDFYDPDKINALLLDQEPIFEPGSASGYHAVTFGPLVGELVRRVAGKSLGTFLRDEVTEPRKADFYIGLPESEDHRVAELIRPPAGAAVRFAGGEVQQLGLGNPKDDPERPNDRAWRAAEIPSVNGQGNAAGLARIYAVLAHGGEADGTRLLSRETIEEASAPQIAGADLVLGVPMHWGCGFIRNELGVLYGPNQSSFGHTGYGGSFGYADLEADIGVGYAMNRMGLNLIGDPRTVGLIQALYASL